jgi:hypothetical protein
VLAVAKNVFNIQSTRSSANDRVLPVESRNKRQQMTADVDPDHLTTIDANDLESHGPVLRRPVQAMLPVPADTIMMMLVPPLLHLHSIRIDKGCCCCCCCCHTGTVKILEGRQDCKYYLVLYI